MPLQIFSLQLHCSMKISVLTSLSGLLFNCIFPILDQLGFPNFLKTKSFKKPPYKQIILNQENWILCLIL